MVHIVASGTQYILPAFVIGYELPLPKNPDFLEELSPWLVTVDHQIGGYACNHISAIGAVLRLEGNRDKGKQPLDSLINGLEYMAEDPNRKLLRSDYPVLSELVCTHGHEYSDIELRSLESYLSTYLSLPKVQGGKEAFIRFAPCDPMRYFAGWNLLDCTVRDNAKSSIYSDCYEERREKTNCFFVDESNVDDLKLTEETTFTNESMEVLAQLGDTCGASISSLNVLLLWENSD